MHVETSVSVTAQQTGPKQGYAHTKLNTYLDILTSSSNKAKDFIVFLRKIRQINPEKRIVVILDNFRTHHAKKVRKEAKNLNISLVYLTPPTPLT